MQGTLIKKGDARKQARFFLLFSDMFIFTKEEEQKAKGKNKGKNISYDIRRVMSSSELQTAKITSYAHSERAAGETLCFRFELPDYDTTLYVESTGSSGTVRLSWGKWNAKGGRGPHRLTCSCHGQNMVSTTVHKPSRSLPPCVCVCVCVVSLHRFN